MELIRFASGNRQLAANLLEVTDAPVVVLFLHGGGNSSKAYYVEWQEYIAKHGYSSMAMDFTGVADSDGDYEDGTLRQRMKDALSAVDHLSRDHTKPIVVSGSSMGGHVAARICNQRERIAGVLLHSAAAYGVNAEDKKLNEAFTRVLRSPDSFVDSPAFAQVANFDGALALSYGELEERIPVYVQQTYIKIVQRKGGEVWQIAGASHTQLDPERTQLEQRVDLYSKSVNYLKTIASN